MKIIKQYFDVDVKGHGIFAIFYKRRDEEEVYAQVPLFGFNRSGEVISQYSEDKDYVLMKEEWADKEISKAVENTTKTTGTVYVGIVKRKDTPNKIGIITGLSEFYIPDFSVKVKEERL